MKTTNTTSDGLEAGATCHGAGAIEDVVVAHRSSNARAMLVSFVQLEVCMDAEPQLLGAPRNRRSHTHSLVIFAASVVAGCASTTSGAQPHDMSAAEHDREADQHARTADQHAAEYDAHATVATTTCGRFHVCWTETQNPTEQHREMAEQHRRAAADHRAGSAALRAAEANACSGIDPDDRDISPFEHPGDVARVTVLDEQHSGKAAWVASAGAIVTLRAVPGLTVEWLQRVVDCHLARNQALGHAVPEMPNCPLVPKGASARVRSTGDGFAVEIRSDDSAMAAEILARANRLMAPR